MQTLLLLAILYFIGPISAGCVDYDFPDNINKQNCENGVVEYFCADGFVMNIVATCDEQDVWHNEPTCVAATTTNTVPPDVTVTTVCSTQLDVVFVIDGSSSVGSDNFNKMINALYDALSSMNIGSDSVHVAALVYSKEVFDSITFGSDQSKLENEFSSLSYPYVGGTRTDKGIKKGKKLIQNEGRSGVQGVMVVITDGQSTKPKKTKKEARKAINYGIEIYAVGIGNADQEELDEIASSSDNVFHFDDFGAFKTNIVNVINAVCPE